MILSDEALEEFKSQAEELPEVDLFGDHERPSGVVMDLSDWSMEEELYVGHHHEGPRRGSSSWSVRGSWLGPLRAFSVRQIFGGLAKLGLFVGVLLALKSFVEQNQDQ